MIGVSEDFKRVVWNECVDCGHVQMPDRVICRKCLSTNFKPIESNESGVVVTYTFTTALPSGLVGIKKAVFAIANLGKGISILGRIVNLPEERPSDITGKHVSLKWGVQSVDQDGNELEGFVFEIDNGGEN